MIATRQPTLPFVKWAGGKQRLFNQIVSLMPPKFGVYYEPMVGGGSTFFQLAPERAVLNDSNSELITTFKVVRDSVDDLIDILKQKVNSPEHFYSERSSIPTTDVDIAARFIYLNKLGFNGLYRVNANGKFNVPYCKDESRVILNEVRLRSASNTLQETEILCGDYKDGIKGAKKGDLVFIDPPYLGTFNNYTASKFSMEDQIDLCGEVQKLHLKGVMFMVCNSHHEAISRLYRDFKINIVQDRFVISRDGNKRNQLSSVIVTNY